MRLITFSTRDWLKLFSNSFLDRFEQDIVVIDSRFHQLLSQETVVLEDFMTMCLVHSGELQLTLNEDSIVVKPRSYVILLQGQLCKVEQISKDFLGQYMLISNDFLSRIQVKDSHQVTKYILNTPYAPLGAAEYEALTNSFNMIRGLIHQKDNPYQAEVLYHLVKSFYYGLGYYIHHGMKNELPMGREEQITKMFTDLVNQHYRREHGVVFYASCLHISPKYLSECVKQTLGVSAKQYIRDMILQYARTMLMRQDLTISEIANQLYFTDQSTFGKYFRSYMGIGPKQWRKKNVK